MKYFGERLKYDSLDRRNLFRSMMGLGLGHSSTPGALKCTEKGTREMGEDPFVMAVVSLFRCYVLKTKKVHE